MKNFRHAIVRIPCKKITQGLTSANLGSPDYSIALSQHKTYIAALQQIGIEVTVIQPDDAYPDSTFVEDTALLTPNCAIITRPGASSRRGEIKAISEVVRQFYKHIEYIESPGCVDAGDIMMAGDFYYIGLSTRTNNEGAIQVISILRQYGMDGTTVSFSDILHLKSGVAYLENNNLVISGEFINKPEFNSFNHIIVDPEESYGANCVWINGAVLVAQGFPGIIKKIEKAGYNVVTLDMSEFRKLDGGLSCLSLRF